MRTMKDSDVAWIGEIPEEWEALRLKYIFSERDERCGADTELPLLSVSEYYGVAKRKDKIKEDETLIRAETLEGYKICHPHDIVSNIMLAWKSALGESPSIGIVSPSYCVYQPVSDICTRYFHYLLRTNIYANVFKQYSTGIIDSRLRLYSDKFLSLFVQVPPVDEQHRIADFLDTKCAEIDRSMELVRQSIDKLKEYKKSVITEAVTRGLDPDVPMKDSGVPWIGDIPEGWTLTKIAYGIDYTGSGTTPPSDQPQWYQGNIPWITTSELRESIIYTTNKCVSELTLNTFSALKLYPKGSLIIAMYGATIGRMGFLGIEGTTNQACCVLYGESQLTLKYIFYFIFSLKEIILSLGQGSGQPNLTQETIRALRVPAPTISEQKHITAYLDAKCAEIDALITQKQALLDKLAEYKKSLIFEYVTGKREVPA